MSILKVARLGHPVLRAAARAIDRSELKGQTIQKLIDDMIETMKVAPGVGLAAPQIGVPLRLAVIEVDETITVIEGRVTIQEKDGATREFKAGDVVHFPIGLECTWTVHETIRKFFALLSPQPLSL